MSNVSLVDGHIDSDKNEMTPQETLDWVKDCERAIKEEQAIVNNGDEFHVEALKHCEVVKQALEKQIPKKVKIEKYRGKTLVYCSRCDALVCEIQNIGQGFCSDCGQLLDWSDTE